MSKSDFYALKGCLSKIINFKKTQTICLEKLTSSEILLNEFTSLADQNKLSFQTNSSENSAWKEIFAKRVFSIKHLLKQFLKRTFL